MNDRLREIGNSFKDKRKEMHLSIKEVENATSIRMSYLEAIEDGEIYKFLSGVYAVGFIRQYACFLGFDAEKIIKENPEAFLISQKKQDFSYGIGTLDMRGNPSGGLKWLPNLFWIGISLFVLTVAWYFARFLGVI